MAAISGVLRFDKKRTGVSSSNLTGIANVPIVLQNTGTNEMLSVYTDANGYYAFTNVPNGNYRIVEAYGMAASASPGNLSAAAAGSPVKSVFPPITFASDPPAGATNLDAVTPSALLVTAAGADITGQDILNGPVKYTPIEAIMDTGVIVLPPNLITEADNGTFGGFPQGTPANTGANPNPYPDIGTRFIYTQPNPAGVTPAFHQYTIQNIMNDGTANVQNTWWRIADHTSGDERGRMMVINGDAPGSVIFEQKVSVKPSTAYLFSSWILNLAKSTDLADPQLGVEVMDANGQTIYNQTLGALIPMNPDNPEWKQIGTLIHSGDNTSLTIRFVSMGPEAHGNDYVIDDITLNEVQVIAYFPKKTADTSEVTVGDTAKYTIMLENTGINPLTNVVLSDFVPDGLIFVPGSVVIDGVSSPASNPNTGFSVPDILSGSTLTVTFSVAADHVPAANPTINRASVDYSYSYVRGGISSRFSTKTNVVPINIIVKAVGLSADLSIVKTVFPPDVLPCGTVTYTLVIANAGPSDAADVSVLDSFPGEIRCVYHSMDNGKTWEEGIRDFSFDSIAAGSRKTIQIKGVVCDGAASSITNEASVISRTPDPNPYNNRSVVSVNVREKSCPHKACQRME